MENGGELTDIVRRNIHALADVRRKSERQRRLSDRIADVITSFAGSVWSVYVHLTFFGGWIAFNSGALPWKPFDPFPFVMLAMAASVEAIFLSTFVLISQNRIIGMSETRAQLDLQTTLLTEHELTRLIRLVDAIATKLEIAPEVRHELDELKKDVQPEVVLREIERAEGSPI